MPIKITKRAGDRQPEDFPRLCETLSNLADVFEFWRVWPTALLDNNTLPCARDAALKPQYDACQIWMSIACHGHLNLTRLIRVHSTDISSGIIRGEV